MSHIERENVFPADISEIENIRKFAFSELDGLSSKRILHMELALEEIVVNICSYAYEVPPGEITIKVIDCDESVSLEFIDTGVPFDPFALDDPNIAKPLMDRDQGGLGILLVRRVMDEVHYSRKDDTNQLRVVVRKLP